MPATAKRRLRITPSPYHDDALADARAEALVDVRARLGQRQLNNFRLLEIEATAIRAFEPKSLRAGWIHFHSRPVSQTQFCQETTLRKHTLTQPAGRSCAGLDCLQHRSDLMVKCTTLTTSAGNLSAIVRT